MSWKICCLINTEKLPGVSPADLYLKLDKIIVAIKNAIVLSYFGFTQGIGLGTLQGHLPLLKIL